MATLADVQTAVNGLQTAIQALAAAATGVTKSAVAGAFTLVSNIPTLTLATAIDPRDLIRVNYAITVAEHYKIGAGTGFGTFVYTSVNRVYARTEVAGVNADGVTCPLARVPFTVGNYSSDGIVGGDTVYDHNSQTFDIYMTLVSATPVLVTRYH